MEMDDLLRWPSTVIAPVQPSRWTVTCWSNAGLRVPLQARRHKSIVSATAVSSPTQRTAARIAQEMLQKLLQWGPAAIAPIFLAFGT